MNWCWIGLRVLFIYVFVEVMVDGSWVGGRRWWIVEWVCEVGLFDLIFEVFDVLKWRLNMFGDDRMYVGCSIMFVRCFGKGLKCENFVRFRENKEKLEKSRKRGHKRYHMQGCMVQTGCQRFCMQRCSACCSKMQFPWFQTVV